MAASKMSSAPSTATYSIVVAFLVAFSVLGGYNAGIQPAGQWRFFSWHPLLMTIGMVGLMGISAMTKKLGGYTNTKLHGMIGWGAMVIAFGGIYCIYKNKEMYGKSHLATPHALCGAGVMACCVGLGMAGGIFLHPDFGVDKTNQLIRKAHKIASRVTLAFAWITAIGGLMQLTSDKTVLAMYGVPLLALIPIALM